MKFLWRVLTLGMGGRKQPGPVHKGYVRARLRPFGNPSEEKASKIIALYSAQPEDTYSSTAMRLAAGDGILVQDPESGELMVESLKKAGFNILDYHIGKISPTIFASNGMRVDLGDAFWCTGCKEFIDRYNTYDDWSCCDGCDSEVKSMENGTLTEKEVLKYAKKARAA